MDNETFGVEVSNALEASVTIFDDTVVAWNVDRANCGIAQIYPLEDNGFGKITDYPETDLEDFYFECESFFIGLQNKKIINRKTFRNYMARNNRRLRKLGTSEEGRT